MVAEILVENVAKLVSRHLALEDVLSFDLIIEAISTSFRACLLNELELLFFVANVTKITSLEETFPGITACISPCEEGYLFEQYLQKRTTQYKQFLLIMVTMALLTKERTVARGERHAIYAGIEHMFSHDLVNYIESFVANANTTANGMMTYSLIELNDIQKALTAPEAQEKAKISIALCEATGSKSAHMDLNAMVEEIITEFEFPRKKRKVCRRVDNVNNSPIDDPEHESNTNNDLFLLSYRGTPPKICPKQRWQLQRNE